MRIIEIDVPIITSEQVEQFNRMVPGVTNLNKLTSEQREQFESLAPDIQNFPSIPLIENREQASEAALGLASTMLDGDNEEIYGWSYEGVTERHFRFEVIVMPSSRSIETYSRPGR